MVWIHCNGTQCARTHVVARINRRVSSYYLLFFSSGLPSSLSFSTVPCQERESILFVPFTPVLVVPLVLGYSGRRISFMVRAARSASVSCSSAGYMSRTAGFVF